MFKYTYIIQKEDINSGNHVGNERALLYFQNARSKFLASYGLAELNLGEDIGIIQLNAFVEYRTELFLGQELEIQISKIEVNGIKIIFHYSVVFENKIVINGYTTMACFDYNIHKIKKIPSHFLEILKKFN